MEYKFLVQKESRKGPAQWQSFQGNYRVTPVANEVLLATSDWTKASAELSSLGPSGPSEKEPEKEKDTKDRAAAKQEKEEILLKMAESGVDKAAAEVTSTCPLAVTLENREMSRRNFSQSLLALDATEPSPSHAQDKDVKDVKLDSKDSKEPQDSKDQSEATDAKDASPKKEAKAEPQEIPKDDSSKDVVVVQTPLDEDLEDLEVPLRNDESSSPTRGVSLRHITSFSALETVADPETKAEHRKGKKTAQSHYDPYNLNVPVVIVSSEVAPYSKTGGLGMVAASYAFEFARNGHRTMVVSPKYKHFEGINYIGETRVRVNDTDEVVKYFHMRKDYEDGKGTDYLFIEA